MVITDYSANGFQSEVEDRQVKSQNTVFVAFISQQIMVLSMEDTSYGWFSPPSTQGSPKYVRWEDD